MSGSTSCVVVFNFTTWSARYPEFASLDPDLAQLYFNEATMYVTNDGSSLVNPIGPRTLILYALTAHIAQLNNGSSLQPNSPLVGRISNATEGTVSLATDMGPVTANSAWFMQTKYGASAWQMLKSGGWLSARYFARRRPYFGVGGFGRVGFAGWRGVP